MRVKERTWVSFRRLHRETGFDRELLRRLATERERYYRPFHLLRGTKSRHIDNPVGLLKDVQKAIARTVLTSWQAPREMYGAIRGRTARQNARQHLGALVLAKVDIRQCYPSITEEQVRSALLLRLGCSEPIARVITRLTTVNDHLPQGAPTSGAIANMVLEPFCDELRTRLTPWGVKFTMFVDDIGLSGARARDAVELTVALLHSHGFRVSGRKVEVMPRHESPQVLTGFTTNRSIPGDGDAVSVGQSRLGNLRGAILRAARDPATPVEDISRIWAQIRWVKTQCADQGEALERLAMKFLPVVRGSLARRADNREPCTCALGRGLGDAVPDTSHAARRPPHGHEPRGTSRSPAR